MPALAALLFGVYLVLLGAKGDGPTWARLSDMQFALEVAFDLLAIAAALRVREKLIAGAFVATLVSTTNYYVLSNFFGVKLPETMGHWLELEINAPYVTCYLLGAAALFGWARADRRRVSVGAVIALVSMGLTLVLLLPGLGATKNPIQNRVLHVACFTVSAAIHGFGLVNLADLARPRRVLVALGFLSLALEGLCFQVTEIFPKAYALDNAMDLTWTLGQFSVICGLLVPDESA